MCLQHFCDETLQGILCFSVLLTPWERRNETKTAKKRRKEREVKKEIEKMQQLANEKNNAIDQYLLSDNEKVTVYQKSHNRISIK